MSSEDNILIQGSLQAFHKELQSSVPLRHFSQHLDEAKIRQVAAQASGKIQAKFVRKMNSSKVGLKQQAGLFSDLCSELEKAIEEYLTNHRDSMEKSESFLEKRMEVCSDDFQTSINVQLLINPDMDLKSVEDFFESGKPKATDYFGHLWKHGNVGGFEEQKSKLEDKLDGLKKEMVEKQTRALEFKEEENARKSLEDLREILIAMARQIKFEIHELQETVTEVTKETLKEKVQEIHGTLIGKGKVVKEKYEKLYVELLGVLEASVKLLDKAIEDMSVEQAVEWADKIIGQLQSCFLGNEPQSDITITEPGMSANKLVSADMELDQSLEREVEVSIQQGNDGFGIPSNDQSNSPEMDQDETSIRSDDCLTNDEALFGVGIGTKRPHREDQEADNAIVTLGLTATKRLKQVGPNDLKGTEGTTSGALENLRREEVPVDSFEDDNVNPLNEPDKNGDFPLLRAIFDGESFDYVKKMLDRGADVNIKSKDSFEYNAAHTMINALINQVQSPAKALPLLNLLVAKGFNLINDRNSEECTPLILAMQYEDLNEDILTWFYQNGADFNYVDADTGNSVLFHAIFTGQAKTIIRKIIDFGGNPNYICKYGCNALHMSALYSNESALEFFIDEMEMNNMNEGNVNNGDSPLHLLFSYKGQDHRYERCLELLLKNRADFAKKNEEGLVPLVYWMKYADGNPFPTIVKMKDRLPITLEIASDVLTVIVQEMKKHKKFLPSLTHSSKNEFFQFVLFLIEKKKAKILWRDANQWESHDWQKIDKAFFTRNFFRKLKTSTGRVSKGDLVRVSSQNRGELELVLKSSSVSVPIETILACLLASKNYRGFMELFGYVEELC